MFTATLNTKGDIGWAVCGRNLVKAFGELRCEFELVESWDRPVDKQWPVLNMLNGPTFQPVMPVTGTYNVAYGFIENMDVACNYLQQARRWDAIVCGSHWMRDRLAQMGLENLSVALQGVDPLVFNSGKRRLKSDVFRICIPAKFEYRKGQDVAIVCARELIRKYPDVHIVLPVCNKWPASQRTMERSKVLKVPILDRPTREVIPEIMAMNGIPRDRYEYVECPHEEMADVYRSCDVGLFLSRCEGGNHLCLLEAQACGLPCIVNYATGQKDGCAFSFSALITFSRVEDENGWVEPDENSVIEHLEWCYRNRKETEVFGQNAETFVQGLTWKKCAVQLLRAINQGS